MSPIPAPDDFVWFEGLRWVEAVKMQAERVSETMGELIAAHADAAMRADLRAPDSDSDREWRAHFDAEPDIGRRPTRVLTWALEMQMATEVDFLIVAVRNVMRAQDRLPSEVRTSMTDDRILKLLRDASEHFDEVEGPALTALSRDHPDILRGAIASTGKEVWIGGEAGVPLSRVQAWVMRAETALRNASAELGFAIPEDLLVSRIEGDDDLDWPQPRLRYGWWLPTFEESDWPTEAMPDAIATLLAERFRTKRLRDGVD